MANNSTRLELKLPKDARAVKAVQVAVEHFANKAGLSAAAQAAFAGATESVCRDAMDRLGENGSGLRVVVENFSDRLEVTFEHPGEPLRMASPLPEVDRVHAASQEGRSRLTLVKYFAAHPSER